MQNKNAIIEVNNLNKSFAGKPAVIDLSIEVKQGEICGKTTTLRMLCGLLIPDSGEGHCLGYDILTDAYEIKKQVGYMTQSFSLYNDLTAYENLDFIARIYQLKNRRQEIVNCLQQFGLEKRKDQLAGNLSGGWKQRLALAGCLLHKPKLLLLDEPTAGVDPKARREFWDEIHKLSSQGITTLASTHYMDEAERCTRLVYISQGHLLAEGTLQDIINKSHLHTWVATGENLIELRSQIEKMPGIEQVAFFGAKLHVSGTHDALLEKSITSLKNQAVTWNRIKPGLEDVFISLVDKSQQTVDEKKATS
jgi:ABC-2 type transport system ATP-binding protein